MEVSEKQEAFITESDAFINVADGAVRSGKTFSALHRFAELCIAGPPGDMMVLGRTERTIRRNVIYPLTMTFGPRIRYVQGMGELHFAGRLVHIVGANNAAAESKVRGSTLAGAFCNELTLIPENVFKTLIDRCSIDGAQILADTNPDSPYHWLHKDFLTNEDLLGHEVKRWQFRLDDNPALSEEYKNRIKRLHSGLWYKRMVDGLWVVAEGAIYDMFDEDRHVIDELPFGVRIMAYYVGIDYGTANSTVFLLVGVGSDQRLYVMDEWRWDSRERGAQMTNAQYSAAFIDWLRGLNVTPWRIFGDPSALSFLLQLRHDGVKDVHAADNDVVDGIRDTASLLSTDRLRILRRCEGLIAEMTAYAWNPKAQARGEDAPLKQADHGPDSLRYVVNETRPIWGRWVSPVGLVAA